MTIKIEDGTFKNNGKTWKFVRFCKFNDLDTGDFYFCNGSVFQRGKGFEPRPDDKDFIIVVVVLCRWRAKIGETYYHIGDCVFGRPESYEAIETGHVSDDNHWKCGNYFRTQDEGNERIRRALEESW